MKRPPASIRIEPASLNLPNWRDESEYARTLTPDGWAWEFLRRNLEYQKDFRELQLAGSAQLKKRLIAKWGFMLMVPVDPAIRATGTKSPARFWPQWFLTTDVKDGSRSKTTTTVDWQLRPNEVAIKFDISLPLKPQRAAAKFYLKDRQKILASRNKKNPRASESVRKDAPHFSDEDLVKFLRLLDAKGSTAKGEGDNIAYVLGFTKDPLNQITENNCKYRDLKSVSKLTKSFTLAKRLCAVDYRLLVIRPNAIGKKNTL